MSEKNIPVNVYAENTPNAAAMKFVTDFQLLHEDFALEFNSIEEAANLSPLATELFKFPFVKSVHIKPFFITIIKNDMAEWGDISKHLRDEIRAFIIMGFSALNMREDMPEKKVEDLIVKPETTDDTSKEIMKLLDEYVRPAVESDGGTIQFRSFKEGVVKVSLGGSCSGCPSTNATLKGGVERLLTQMLPDQVKEVVADEQ